jgi:hypothetical protein
VRRARHGRRAVERTERGEAVSSGNVTFIYVPVRYVWTGYLPKGQRPRGYSPRQSFTKYVQVPAYSTVEEIESIALAVLHNIIESGRANYEFQLASIYDYEIERLPITAIPRQ